MGAYSGGVQISAMKNPSLRLRTSSEDMAMLTDHASACVTHMKEPCHYTRGREGVTYVTYKNVTLSIKDILLS